MVTKKPVRLRVKKDLRMYGGAYIMLMIVLAYYIIFHYTPMFGAVIAFKDFKPRLGIWGSKWVGWKNFESFFSSYYFWRPDKEYSHNKYKRTCLYISVCHYICPVGK